MLQKGPRTRARRPPLAVDDVEMSADRQAANPQRAQAASRDLAGDRVDGEEGGAEPRHHRLFDGLGVAELHADRVLDAGDGQRALRHSPGGRALFAHQERLLREVLRRDVPTPGPRVLRGNDHDELVDQTGRQTTLAPGQLVAADYAQIELVGTHTLLDDVRVRDIEVQVDAGVV